MIEIVNKYAKDLQPGDKINGHEKGWLVVKSKRRLQLSTATKIVWENGNEDVFDSHALFPGVIVEL